MDKICTHCGKSYKSSPTRGGVQKYCSKKCQLAFVYGNGVLPNKIPPGTVGALSELIASADLMRKGFEVYRALSPASSCDVLAIKGKKVFTFEVRTGYKSTDGKRITVNRTNQRAENLIIVIRGTNEIVYEPEI